METVAFITLLVEIITGSLSLEASKRLLTEVLYVLYQDSPEEICLSKVVEALIEVRAHPLSRAGQYREALLFSLGDVLRRTGDSLNYVESNFLPEVFSEPKTFVISCGGFGPSILSLVISVFFFYIYETRRQRGQTHPPVYMVMDDAMNLIFGSSLGESQHEARPILDWVRQTRFLGIHSFFGGQNYAESSPIIRNNCPTLICLGGTGQDAIEMARHMNLDSDQAAVIPQLTRGEGIIFARNQWPFALKVELPDFEAGE